MTAQIYGRVINRKNAYKCEMIDPTDCGIALHEVVGGKIAKKPFEVIAHWDDIRVAKRAARFYVEKVLNMRLRLGNTKRVYMEGTCRI